MFLDTNPTLDDCWRSIILFGSNVASYKFALAKALLEFKDRGSDLIRLDELAEPFSRHICERISQSPKQATSRSSRFLDSCKKFNDGMISKDQLISLTTKLGFANVIDAFHVVNRGEVPTRFFIDERQQNSGIRLTEELFKLFEDKQSLALGSEVESRWRLVETAWALNISRNLIHVDYDAESELLIARDLMRRVNVTSCRDALNGYQKGHCFYCFDYISVLQNDADLAEVDHFFPHTLKDKGFNGPVNGVWNLVLTCRDCNRGINGKSARIPTINLLKRLKMRNDFLISSHHPLRETLMQQTGTHDQLRNEFLQRRHTEALKILIHTWEPKAKGPERF